jgi:hypothetical protein
MPSWQVRSMQYLQDNYNRPHRMLMDFAFFVFPDIKSAAVGGVAGSAVTMVIQALEPQPVQLMFDVDQHGYSKPFVAIIGSLKKSEAAIDLKFDPGSLKESLVCEFARIEAKNYSEAAISYLSKQASCFNLKQTKDNEYLVTPNMRSGQMKVVQGTFECKCGPGN